MTQVHSAKFGKVGIVTSLLYMTTLVAYEKYATWSPDVVVIMKHRSPVLLATFIFVKYGNAEVAEVAEVASETVQVIAKLIKLDIL